jgi:hypothetical protein
MARDFYKTIITFEVLSEEPIPGCLTLADIGKEAEYGRYVGRFLERGPNDHILMNGAAMAEALVEAGSEPSFFELDEDGNDYDENEAAYPGLQHPDDEIRAEEQANFEPFDLD